jgi:hypothetical protein
VARLLAASWRGEPPLSDIPEAECREIAPLLLRFGAAGLAWQRVRPLAWSGSGIGRRLQKAYRLQVLHAAVHERSLHRALGALRSAGVEPLLVQGWAVARWYSAPALRPYGDIDLCVLPEQHAMARAALATAGEPAVDLHAGLSLAGRPLLDDRPVAEVWRRSVPLAGDGFVVRTPAREDHLRYLCLHALAHGICRPLWLADLGAAVESGPPLDWDRVLHGNPRRTEWVICGLVLARRLLGARLISAPPRVTEALLPEWLTESVLEGWGRMTIAPGNRTPMAFYLRRPAGVLAALRTRWPSAVEASVGRHAAFDDLPRFPLQVAECAARTLVFAKRLALGRD